MVMDADVPTVEKSGGKNDSTIARCDHSLSSDKSRIACGGYVTGSETRRFRWLTAHLTPGPQKDVRLGP